MQISVMQQRAFTRAAILVVLVALATTQQCKYQVTDKSVINVPRSEKNGVVFISDVYKSSREECQSACCDMEEEELDDGSYVKCNLAVFHHSGKPGKANCFLIYCPSEGSCAFSELRGFSSSFVTYTLHPTEAFNKPPSLKFTNPDARPLILHKLVRRSNGQATDAPKDATHAKKTAEGKAGKKIGQVEANLISMVEQQIKKVESNIKAAGTKAEKVQKATPKSPEKTSSISTTTVLVDDKKKQKGAVVTSVSTTKVSGDPTPKHKQPQAKVDVKTTTKSNEIQGLKGGPPAAKQPISKQAPHMTPPPPQDSSTPQPTTSVKPTAPSLPTNSIPPGSETHLTSKSISGSELKVEPLSSITTHPPSVESSGSIVSQTTTVQPAKVAPDSPPTTQSLKPIIKPKGSSSLSISDSISNATHASTLLESHSSSTLTTHSSSTTTLPTHPTVPLNVTESSLQTPMSIVSNSTLPIVPSTAPSTAPSTSPSTAPSTTPSTATSTAPSTASSTATSTATSTAPSTAPSTATSTAPSTATSTAPSTATSTTPSTATSTAPSTATSTAPSTATSTASSTAPSTSPSTAPSTPTFQITLLHLTSNQSHITPDASPTTMEVTESTQSSTLISDDDVNSPTVASKATSSPKLTTPSKSTPSIPPTILEPAQTIPSSVDDTFRKEMEDNQTLAVNTVPAVLGGNETSAPLANETVGVGNETAAAAQIDTVNGKKDNSTNSLIASNGALIAAVCFGVLFLMAVLVVIGKHWYEAYQRRHYSKVDYLINGMYN